MSSLPNIAQAPVHADPAVATAPGWKLWALVLGVPVVVLLTRLPFLFAGYGMDPDAWRVACIARALAETGQYLVSRIPGYPVQELTSGLLARGGPLALNGATAVCSALAVLFFVLILRRLGSRDALLAGAALASIPVIYISSTVSLDYLWALAFLMAATYAALLRRPWLAGVLLGLAVGCRLTSGLLVFPLLLLISHPGEWTAADEAPKPSLSLIPAQLRACVIMGCTTCAVGLCCFLPVIRVYGRGFLGFFDDPPPLYIQLRHATTDTWGLLGCCALLFACIVLLVPAGRRGASTFATPLDATLPKAWLTAMVLFVLVFISLPHQAMYLIPALPFFLLLLARYLPRRAFQVVCILLILSPWLFTLRSPRHPTEPTLCAFRAMEQDFRIYLPGPILDDLHLRQARAAYVHDVLNFSASQPRPTAVIMMGLMPEIALEAVAHGGAIRLNPTPARHLKYTWESYHLVYAAGDRATFKELLDLGQIRDFQQHGVDVYYMPGAEDAENLFYAVDLGQVGARPLPMGAF